MWTLTLLAGWDGYGWTSVVDLGTRAAMTLGLGLVCAHVTASLVWIGAIVVVGVIVTDQLAAGLRGELATRIYLRVAVPAFVVALLTGGTRLLLDLPYYFVQTHFMHLKLTAALVVVVLHHLIGQRARRLGRAEVADGGATGVWVAVLLAATLVATYATVSRLPA